MIRPSGVVRAAACAAAGILAFVTAAVAADPVWLDQARILRPAGSASAFVLLLSGSEGWQASDQSLAETLKAGGAIVAGVDVPAALAEIDAAPNDCAYLVSGIEALSHDLQRETGTAEYHLPVVAGRGAGAALAIAIAAQTPADTIGHTVALDPDLGIGLAKPLCTQAARSIEDGREVYGLQPGPLPDPIDVIVSSADASAADRLLADLGVPTHPIAVSRVADGPSSLHNRLRTLIAAPSDDDLGASLVPLPAKASIDALAIVYSGDGGWRDLDKTIAGLLQQSGMPTVGVDSLRTFWSRKTPAEVATELTGIIDAYTVHWGVSHVALVGYSFGADILPAAYQALDAPHRAIVSQISLLGLSTAASYEISVSGWLGSHPAGASPTLPDARRIEPEKLQCIYGADESDTACPALAGGDAEVIRTAGGHHFDGNYARLADLIRTGLERRLSAGSALVR